MLSHIKNLNNWIILALIPILGLVFTLALRPPYLVSILLFYGAPALYLVLRYRMYTFALKDLIYTVIVATPFTIIVDYLATINGLWFVPKSLWSSRLFDTIPWEDFLWMFAGTYLIIIFYQTFLDRSKREFVDHKLVRFIVPAVATLGIFFSLLATNYHDFF